MDVILGIDTSCYTTSVALVDISTRKCVNYELTLLKPEKGDPVAFFFCLKEKKHDCASFFVLSAT